MSELVKAVREYAQAHYNEEGWDILVECWSDTDIEECLGNAKTGAEAVRNVEAYVQGFLVLFGFTHY